MDDLNNVSILRSNTAITEWFTEEHEMIKEQIANAKYNSNNNNKQKEKNLSESIENILYEYLINHLPNSYKVIKNALLIDANTPAKSAALSEKDILIVSAQSTWCFRSHVSKRKATIVYNSEILCHIEVKTLLTEESIKEAMVQLSDSKCGDSVMKSGSKLQFHVNNKPLRIITGITFAPNILTSIRNNANTYLPYVDMFIALESGQCLFTSNKRLLYYYCDSPGVCLSIITAGLCGRGYELKSSCHMLDGLFFDSNSISELIDSEKLYIDYETNNNHQSLIKSAQLGNTRAQLICVKQFCDEIIKVNELNKAVNTCKRLIHIFKKQFLPANCVSFGWVSYMHLQRLSNKECEPTGLQLLRCMDNLILARIELAVKTANKNERKKHLLHVCKTTHFGSPFFAAALALMNHYNQLDNDILELQAYKQHKDHQLFGELIAILMFWLKTEFTYDYFNLHYVIPCKKVINDTISYKKFLISIGEAIKTNENNNDIMSIEAMETDLLYTTIPHCRWNDEFKEFFCEYILPIAYIVNNK